MSKTVKDIPARDKRRGKRIKAARIKAGYTSQDALGQAMGRGRSTVARLESGEF